MAELSKVKQLFMSEANKIPDYQTKNVTELANIYCDADEVENPDHKQKMLRSAAFAALMVRYWGKIPRWMTSSKSLNLMPEDFVEWLQHALYVAFYYRAWRYEYEAVVREGKFISWKHDADGNRIPNKNYYLTDPTAVDKIINRCCFSIRGRQYQYENKEKRRVNNELESIDAMVEARGDAAYDQLGGEWMEGQSGVASILHDMITRGDLIEALIVEGIAYQNTFNNEQSAFRISKLIDHLKNIDIDFISEICSKYLFDSLDSGELQEVVAAYDTLRKASRYSINKRIIETLADLRSNAAFIEALRPQPIY